MGPLGHDPSFLLVFEFTRKVDWEEAIHWYDSVLNMTDYDEGGEFDGTQDEPRYLLLAREAEMYQVGGNNLTADPQRAGSNPTTAHFVKLMKMFSEDVLNSQGHHTIHTYNLLSCSTLPGR